MTIDIGRRKFIAALAGAAVAWPLAARGQQREGMRLIGVLLPAPADDPDYLAWVEAFRQTLQELGWTDGRNVRIDIRWATLDVAGIARMRQSWQRSHRTSFWHLVPQP